MKIYTVYNIPSMKKINRLPKKFKAVSLFSGCGGASTGMKLAGFDVLYANEFIPIAAKTYKKNAPKTVVDTTDVRKVTPEKIMKICGVKRGELDYMDASPPCKAFSRASLHSRKGKKADDVVLYSEGVKQRVDDLFFHFARILKGVQPKVFVAENVPGMLAGANRGFFLEILGILQKCGYVVEAAVVNAGQLGTPQNRRRLVFVGVRKDLAKTYGVKPAFPKPLKTVVTVQDVLPHVARIKVGGGRGYMKADIPSPTITASDATNSEMGDMSCGGWIETRDGERRKYKISELKPLFGFPSDFKFIGNYEQRFERLGRTHAPLAVYYVAATIRDYILESVSKKGKSR